MSVGVVGVRAEGEKTIENFKLYDGQEVKQWVDLVADGAEGEGAEEGMEVDS